MTADLAALARVLAPITRRLRVQRGLAWAARCGASAGLTLAIGQLLWRAQGHAGEPAALVVLGAASCLAFVAGTVAPLAPERVATRLDQAGDLCGRTRAALAFASISSAERSAFAEAALRDALARAPEVSPVQAAPYHKPPAARLALGAALLVLALSLWPTRPADAVARERLTEPTVAALAADDLAAFQGELARLERSIERSSELREPLAAYTRLLTLLARGELAADRARAQLQALEAQLAARAGEPNRADDEALAQLAERLARVQRAPGAGARTRDPESAARLLEALGERLGRRELPPSERAQLAEALAEARRSERERLALEQRERTLEQLLKAREPAEAAGEVSLLKARRELERLRRERSQERALHRELARLRRELGSAGEALARADEQAAAGALAGGAEALDRFADAQRQSASRRELAREVAQLRELLARTAPATRPSSAAGAGRGQAPNDSTAQQRAEQQRAEERQQQRAGQQSAEERRQRFRARAVGDDHDAGAELALAGDGTRPVPVDGDGGAGRAARGGREQLVLGGAGGSAELELPGTRSEPSRGGAGSLPSSTPSSEQAAAEPTAPGARGRFDDQPLRGARASGPSRSQVIRGAAQGGFASAPYRRVFEDYRAHAEELLEQDQVPPGYRFYVRRYFQLVRPLERPQERPQEHRESP